MHGMHLYGVDENNLDLFKRKSFVWKLSKIVNEFVLISVLITFVQWKIILEKYTDFHTQKLIVLDN